MALKEMGERRSKYTFFAPSRSLHNQQHRSLVTPTLRNRRKVSGNVALEWNAMLGKMLAHFVPIRTIVDPEPGENPVSFQIIVGTQSFQLTSVHIVHRFLDTIDKQDGRGAILTLGRLEGSVLTL